MHARHIFVIMGLVLFLLPLVFAEVPEHNPALDNQCQQGFQWSRGTVSCKQADCPSGAGRTYTYECNCGEAWDKPFRTCYDPKRPGLVVKCVARGEKCPGEESGPSSPGGTNTTKPRPTKNPAGCGYSDECIKGYACNPMTNKCEPEVPAKKCDEINCKLRGGECKNDECVIINRCENVTCSGTCEGGDFKYSGRCDRSDGKCIYDSKIGCKNGCSKFGNRCKFSVGKVVFVDIDNIVKPLKNIRIESKWYDDLGVVKSELPLRYAKDDGSVELTNNELEMHENGSLEVNVVFEDQSRRIQIVDANTLGPNPTAAQRTALKVAKFSSQVSSNRLMHEFDLNLTMTSGNYGGKFARIYYHALEAADFMKNDLKLAMKNAPERFYVNDPSTGGAFHNGGATKGAADLGISIGPATSAFNDPESPTNREWHEFGHHIMYELYGYHLCCVNANHAGYANPTSIDSYTEGFAEFSSLMMLDYYNYPKKNLYFVGATPYDMEMNFRVNSNSGGLTMEEMSLASIYYDLLDSPANDEDGISLSRKQIWDTISKKYKFGGTERQIESISDAYRALNSTTLPGFHDKWGSVPFFVSKLDRIFITHGVYADSNHNGVWEPGEPIGYTLSGGTARADAPQVDSETKMNRPIVPGSYIKLIVSDNKTAQEIETYPIHGIVHASGVEEGEPVSYDFEYDTLPDENGQININMPPPEYNTTMSFSLGGDENYEQRQNVFELTSDEFYQQIDPDVHSFATYSVTLNPKPQKSSIVIDNEFLKKICPCASAFLLFGIFGAVYKR